MIENICHFIPYRKDYHSIHTVNFVFETKKQEKKELKTESLYKIYLVKSGNGFIHTPGQMKKLFAGDIFFTFPGVPFCIESQEDFSYMYISFIGSRANMIMQKLEISKTNFIFRENSDICYFWENGLDTNFELSDLISESVLLYMFAQLGKKLKIGKDKKNTSDNAAYKIKKYIDDNFSDAEFSLNKISTELNYHKKYISSVFKKELSLGIIEYLNTVRIQQACTMMQQGFTSITDIANCCGFSDPQYFSKIFKSKMHIAPSKYITSLKK